MLYYIKLFFKYFRIPIDFFFLIFIVPAALILLIYRRVGSGRLPMIGLNNGLWGYGPNGLGLVNYQYPDMALNVGQVVIY